MKPGEKFILAVVLSSSFTNPELSAPQVLSGRQLLEIPALLDTQERAP